MFTINILSFVKDFFPNTAEDIDIVSTAGIGGEIENNNIVFNDMIIGADINSGLSYWASGSYSKGSRVIYMNSGGVFIANVDTTSEPTQSADWYKQLDSFIGLNESMNFNGNKIVLEYALNRRFNTSFSQPPGTSVIYIETIQPIVLPFIVGAIEDLSSSVGLISSTGFVMDDYNFTQDQSFAIYFPLADYNNLGADAEKIIRNFVDPLITCGVTYKIITY